MTVIAVVLYTKQPFIGWLCIGQYIAGRSAVHKTLFQKKSDKAAFRDSKLFGSSSEIGAMLQSNKQVIESGFTLQLCVCAMRRDTFSSRSARRSEQSLSSASGEVATSHSFSFVR